MNFPKFSESKEMLKIGQSEVCIEKYVPKQKKSNQKYVTKKVLLNLPLDNLPSFFSKTAYGCFYLNS